MWYYYTSTYFPFINNNISNIKQLYSHFKQLVSSNKCSFIQDNNQYKHYNSLLVSKRTIHNTQHNKTLHALCNIINAQLQRIQTINKTRINELLYSKLPVHQHSNSLSLSLSLLKQSHLLKDFNIHNTDIENYLRYLLNHQKEEALLYFSKDKVTSIEDELNMYSQSSKWKCFVCNKTNPPRPNDNRIFYYCVSCGITVHQICYGISCDVESYNWNCDLCKRYKSVAKVLKVNCLLCPLQGGAMKRIGNSCSVLNEVINVNCNNKDDNDNDNEIYAHVTCVLWNRTIEYENYENKEEIKNIEYITLNDYFEFCDICKIMNSGPVIKCNNSVCSFKCHPECARMNNCCLTVGEVVDEKGNKKVSELYIYTYMYI